MILGGDELGQTQNGNNNAYCQDNELSWLDWDLTGEEREFLEFVAQMISFRRRHPVFSRRRFLQGRELSDGLREVAWLRPDGGEMTDTEWHTTYNRCLGVYLAGTVIERVDKRGKPVRDNNFLVLFNAHHEKIDFLLPEFHAGGGWQVVLDTANAKHPFEQKSYGAGATYPLEGRSTALLISTAPHPAIHYRGGEKGLQATQPPVTIKRPAPAPTPGATEKPESPQKPEETQKPETSASSPSPGATTPAEPATAKPGPAPATPPDAAPANPTQPLPEKLGEDSKGG
jgi:glycogen operon protein